MLRGLTSGDPRRVRAGLRHLETGRNVRRGAISAAAELVRGPELAGRRAEFAAAARDFLEVGTNPIHRSIATRCSASCSPETTRAAGPRPAARAWCGYFRTTSTSAQSPASRVLCESRSTRRSL